MSGKELTTIRRLTNLAVSLALEAGLFSGSRVPNSPSMCSGESSRVPHLERILYIYMAGLAARLRRQNPLSETPWALLLKQPNTLDALQQPSKWLEVFDRWIDLIEIGNVANQALCSSPHTAYQQAKDTKCHAMIRHFLRSLSQWWEEFQRVEGM